MPNTKNIKGSSVEIQTGENSLQLRSSLLCCTKCGETKPREYFKRTLSLAQSRVMLRKPNLQSKHTTISKICKHCRPKAKPFRKLQQLEIYKKIQSGDIHAIKGKLRIDQLKQDIPKVRSRIMKEYWQKKKGDKLKTLRANLAQQVAKYSGRYTASKSVIKNSKAIKEETITRQHAMLGQHRHNYEEAKRVRDYILEEAKAGREFSPTIKIETLMKPQYKPQGEAQ